MQASNLHITHFLFNVLIVSPQKLFLLLKSLILPRHSDEVHLDQRILFGEVDDLCKSACQTATVEKQEEELEAVKSDEADVEILLKTFDVTKAFNCSALERDPTKVNLTDEWSKVAEFDTIGQQLEIESTRMR